LKLSDETDLDILNHSMEVMVHRFQTELLPVAAQLTARLVRERWPHPNSRWLAILTFSLWFSATRIYVLQKRV